MTSVFGKNTLDIKEWASQVGGQGWSEYSQKKHDQFHTLTVRLVRLGWFLGVTLISTYCVWVSAKACAGTWCSSCSQRGSESSRGQLCVYIIPEKQQRGQEGAKKKVVGSRMVISRLQIPNKNSVIEASSYSQFKQWGWCGNPIWNFRQMNRKNGGGCF